MLHRTQVSQVVPVYERFISQYPDLSRFVQAELNDLKIILQPLGLHWRIDLVYRMGQVISQKNSGCRCQLEKTDLLSLPGVSDYIARCGALFCLESSGAFDRYKHSSNYWTGYGLANQRLIQTK